MVKYPTTIDFIHLCDVPKGKERLKALAEATGFNVEIIEPYEKDIDKILDFIQKVDKKYHEMAEEKSFFEENSFFGETLHAHLSSDLRSIIILSISKQDYQANIILRHFIETFIISIWADITSRFQGSFNYFLDTKEWKPYRSHQQVTWDMKKNSLPNRSIKERLERIRLINTINLEGKAFYKEYFSKASYCDFTLLLPLPICEKCMKNKENKGKIKFEEFHLDPKIRKRGKEDKHAVYKTDFGFICSFCGYQKLTQGYARGIPEVPAMSKMLIQVIDDSYVNDVTTLTKFYDHLSEEYVHFSTTIHPDRKPKKQKIGGRIVSFYGLSGVLYCIEFLDHLMDHYFECLQKCNKG
jgi:hypothetical protein